MAKDISGMAQNLQTTPYGADKAEHNSLWERGKKCMPSVNLTLTQEHQVETKQRVDKLAEDLRN